MRRALRRGLPIGVYANAFVLNDGHGANESLSDLRDDVTPERLRRLGRSLGRSRGDGGRRLLRRRHRPRIGVVRASLGPLAFRLPLGRVAEWQTR